MARRNRENESTIRLDPDAAVSQAIAVKEQEDFYRRQAENLELKAEAQRLQIDALKRMGKNSREQEAILAVLNDAIKTLKDVNKSREERSSAASLGQAVVERSDISDVYLKEAANEQERQREYDELKKRRAEEKQRQDQRKRDEELLNDRLYAAKQGLVSNIENSVFNQNAGNVQSLINGLYSGDYKGAAKGLSGIFGHTSEGSIEGIGIAGALEGMGLSSAASVAETMGAAAGGPAIAAILGTMATDNVLDTLEKARYAAMQQGLTGMDAVTLGPGAALQDTLYSFGTGIDSRTIQQVRSTLFKNQAEWGSEEYDQGFNFAMTAQGRYGIGAERAAKYYTDMVIKGGESMEELNTQMEVLHATVQNTSIGMEQMEQVIKDNTATIARSIGGDQLAAQGMALDMQRYYMDGTGRESMIAAGMVGNINFATDPLAYDKYQDYISQGYDETQAMMLASMDYVAEGRVTGQYGGINYFIEPLTSDGLAINDYLAARDFDGLEDALEEFWTARYGNGMTVFGLKAALKAQFGFTEQDVESPQTIADAFRGAIGGVDEAATGETGDYNSLVALDRTDGRVMSASEIASQWSARGSRAINDIMSGNDDIQLYSDRAHEFTSAGFELARLMRDADVDFGDDGVTREELNRMAEALRSAYNESGTDQDFDEWLKSEEGKTQAQLVAERLENDTPGTGGEQAPPPTAVEVLISFVDGLDSLLRAEVINANRAIERDAGEQASG